MQIATVRKLNEIEYKIISYYMLVAEQYALIRKHLILVIGNEND